MNLNFVFRLFVFFLVIVLFLSLDLRLVITPYSIFNLFFYQDIFNNHHLSKYVR